MYNQLERRLNTSQFFAKILVLPEHLVKNLVLLTTIKRTHHDCEGDRKIHP